MTITGLVIGIVLVAVAVLALIVPFVQQSRGNNRSDVEAQKKYDELMTSYERVLATIRDLDEDHQTGKLAPETYQRERGHWTEQGILLLQEIDPDGDNPPSKHDAVEAKTPEVADDVLDDAIEKAIAEYRGVKA